MSLMAKGFLCVKLTFNIFMKKLGRQLVSVSSDWCVIVANVDISWIFTACPWHVMIVFKQHYMSRTFTKDLISIFNAQLFQMFKTM